MRLLAAAFAGLLAVPAHAETMRHCADAWQKMTPAQKGGTKYKDWSAKCMKPDYHLDPVAAAPEWAKAVCKDGKYSRTTDLSKRCLKHGGVKKVL
jgi:hypothetical protein